MYFLAEFKIRISETEAFQRALESGARIEQVFWPADTARIHAGHAAFVFAFAGRSDSELRLAAERLAQAIL